MSPNPSRDAETQAQARASLRSLVRIRSVGGMIFFLLMAVLGAVALAAGYRGGLAALVIGGIGVIGLIAALVRRGPQ